MQIPLTIYFNTSDLVFRLKKNTRFQRLCCPPALLVLTGNKADIANERDTESVGNSVRYSPIVGIEAAELSQRWRTSSGNPRQRAIHPVSVKAVYVCTAYFNDGVQQ